MAFSINSETEEKIASHAHVRFSADKYPIKVPDRDMSIVGSPNIVDRMSPEEFLAIGPSFPKAEDGWPGEFYARDVDDQPTYRLPRNRPTAEQFTAALESIASTDRPARDYPEDFFSREVVYGNQD